MLKTFTSWILKITPTHAIYTIIIIGLAVYFNSLFNGFVWDDEEQIVNNTIIHSLSNLSQVLSGATFNTGGAGLSGWFFRPFLTLYYMLSYAIFGSYPFGYHLLQLLFHIINAIFLFFILIKLLDNKYKITIALIISLVFTVHSAITEAVVYIAAASEILFTFFNLVVLLLLLYFKDSKPLLKLLVTITALLLSGTLFKESSLTIIPILISFVILFNFKFKQLFIISFALTAILYFFIRLIIVNTPIQHPQFAPIAESSLLERIQTIPKIITHYLELFIYPEKLAISQHFVVKHPNLPDFYLPLIIILILFVLIGYISFTTRSRIIYFGICWLIFASGLILNIFPLDMTVAERWLYFPILGLLIILAGIFNQFFKSSKSLLLLICVLIPFIIFLSSRTVIRNYDWKNGLTLYSHDAKVSLNSFDLENNLGVELFRAGQIDQAKHHFKNSITLQPKWHFAYNNLGAVYEHQQDYTQAKQYYQKTLEFSDYHLAHENLANLLLFHESSPAAAKSFTEESLSKLPNNPKLWLILALSEYKLGHKSKALQAAQNAFYLQPTQQSYYVLKQIQSDQPIEF